MKIQKTYILLLLVAGLLASCSNQDKDFPDFDYQSVYFANPYYVRTIELGDDMSFDTSLDNEHKMKIMAFMGGVYKNNKNRVIDFKVSESLCDNLYFSDGGQIIPMPTSYYKLSSNQIVIPSGTTMGGVEVELADEFFEDPGSLMNTYAIPLIMTDVQGADTILRGAPQVENPDRCIDAHWTVKPQDFVICVVKFVNPWHANYLRRGVDRITSGEGIVTNIRHQKYVEQDEEVSITTNSLTKATLPLTIKDNDGKDVHFNVLMDFNDDGTCIVSASTDTYEVTGSGMFVSKGEKNSIGGKDRDALYLDYQVNFTNLNVQYVTKDTLVVRDRGIVPEYFTVERK